MKPKKKDIIQFTKSINLDKFALIGEISVFENFASAELIEFNEDPGDIHNKIAKTFNFESVDSQDEFGNIHYMVNLPNYGSFGIRRTKALMFNGYNFDFVIHNNKNFKSFKSLVY